MPLIDPDEARSIALRMCSVLPASELTLDRAAGCVVAEDLAAEFDIPSFANSAVDGWAVRSEDLAATGEASPTQLKIVGEVLAGDSPELILGQDQCARIFTGAPIPGGADAVVMQEVVTADAELAIIATHLAAGNCIRLPGSDVRKGTVVIRAGDVLDPARVGLAAAVGRQTVHAHPRPRVGVLSTGSELVEPGAELSPGKIHDSNRPALLALVNSTGFRPVDLGHCRDEEAELSQRVAEASNSCDAVIVVGGVSVGDHDYSRKVIEQLSDPPARWMQIAIKPGKPFCVGRCDSTPIFGIPGNPVAALVSFEWFVRPALRRMAGEESVFPALTRGVLQECINRKPDGKLHLVRVRVTGCAEDGSLNVLPLNRQESYQLSALAQANALAAVPNGEGIDVGEAVWVHPLDWTH